LNNSTKNGPILTILVLTNVQEPDIITSRSELQKVPLLAPSVCGFCLCMKYLGNRWMDFCQIHTEDMFSPLLRRVWRSRSKVKVTRDENGIFWSFLQPERGLCFI